MSFNRIVKQRQRRARIRMKMSFLTCIIYPPTFGIYYLIEIIESDQFYTPVVIQCRYVLDPHFESSPNHFLQINDHLLALFFKYKTVKIIQDTILQVMCFIMSRI